MTQTAEAKPHSSLLLTPQFMARLDRLDLVSRKLLAGKMKGERRSKRKGQSVEFADFRNYSIGDDLRFIDWNIYARLEKLLLKLFLEEEDLSLYILLDTSKSCDFGQPNKAFYIKQVAAALAYIGLVNYNRVTLAAMNGTDAGRHRQRSAAGPRSRRCSASSSKLHPPGRFAGDLATTCKRFAVANRRKRRVRGPVRLLRQEAATKTPCVMWPPATTTCSASRSLSPQEIEPDLQGDLKLKDIEDNDEAEVSITQPLIKQYKSNLNAYCLGLKDYLTRRGGTYLFTSTAVPFDTLVLNYLRERGLLG